MQYYDSFMVLRDHESLIALDMSSFSAFWTRGLRLRIAFLPVLLLKRKLFKPMFLILPCSTRHFIMVITYLVLKQNADYRFNRRVIKHAESTEDYCMFME